MKPIVININLYDKVSDTYTPTKAEAWLLDQNELPDFKFYITKNPIIGGYSLTEYVTGFCMSGYYPEPSRPKAAAWLKTRLELHGKKNVIAIILDQQSKYPKIN